MDEHIRIRPSRVWILMIAVPVVGLLGLATYRSWTFDGLRPTFFGTVALVVVALTVSIRFLFFYYVDVTGSKVLEARWFGLFSRRVDIESLTSVTTDTRDGMFGTVVRIQLRWPGNVMQVADARYRPADLRRLVLGLQARGVPVSNAVLHAIAVREKSKQQHDSR